MYDFSTKSSQIMSEGNKNTSSSYIQNNPTTSQSQRLRNMKESTWEAKSTKSAFRESTFKAKVEEHIEMPTSTTGHPQERKFAFYRDIQLTYDVDSCQMIILNEEDGRSSSHVLQELSQEDNLMLQLQFRDEEDCCFVKFRSKKDFDYFVNGIYSASDAKLE